MGGKEEAVEGEEGAAGAGWLGGRAGGRGWLEQGGPGERERRCRPGWLPTEREEEWLGVEQVGDGEEEQVESGWLC